MKLDRKQIVRWAALAGAVLALVCHYLPANYQAICQTLANLCTGG